MSDPSNDFLQVSDGNPAHYCRHGFFIGSPYGADLLCPYCESGDEPPAKVYRLQVIGFENGEAVLAWDSWDHGRSTHSATGSWEIADDCMTNLLADGYEPLDLPSERALGVVREVAAHKRAEAAAKSHC